MTTEVKAAASTVSKRATVAAPVQRALQGLGEETTPPVPLTAQLTTPSSVTPLDAEIIKLTAQYTAASGRQFLAGLAQREQRNPQFDFLKPTHVLFSYFTQLVDATRVPWHLHGLRAEVKRRGPEHALKSARDGGIGVEEPTRRSDERRRSGRGPGVVPSRGLA